MDWHVVRKNSGFLSRADSELQQGAVSGLCECWFLPGKSASPWVSVKILSFKSSVCLWQRLYPQTEQKAETNEFDSSAVRSLRSLKLQCDLRSEVLPARLATKRTSART